MCGCRGPARAPLGENLVVVYKDSASGLKESYRGLERVLRGAEEQDELARLRKENRALPRAGDSGYRVHQRPPGPENRWA